MEHSAPALVAAAAALGVRLGTAQSEQLLLQLDLLQRWNRTHNLVGPGAPPLWLERHTLDSLAAAAYLPSGPGYDVGSGAGFPGIPLAVARPDCRFTLVEPREKRAAFLVNTIASLKLQNAKVVQERFEPAEGLGEAAFALSRATLALPAWLTLAASLLASGGLAVAFLGLESWDLGRVEAAAKGTGLIDARLQGYQIGDQPTRTLALLHRA